MIKIELTKTQAELLKTLIIQNEISMLNDVLTHINTGCQLPEPHGLPVSEELNAAWINRQIANVQAMVGEGYANPIKLYAALKAIAEATTKAMEAIRKDVQDELEKYGQEGYHNDYVSIVVRSGGSRLDYSADPVWASLSEQMKKREQLLKAASRHNGYYLTDDGEVVPRVPEKPVSDSIVISFKKK